MTCVLSPLFSEGMVLQRECPVKIWGKADETVKVSLCGQERDARPDKDGNWLVTFDPLPPGGPYEMMVGEHISRKVYVGDVWLCGGQSNMELPLQRVRYMYPEDLQNPNPHIHAFVVPQKFDFHAPCKTLSGGNWRGTSPETVGEFSAAGYFFAKRIYESQGVPQGLLMTAVGGTPIHAWMSREALADFPDALEEAKRCADEHYVGETQKRDAENAVAFQKNIRKNDPGLKEKWASSDYDDSFWEERDLWQPWEGCGSVWWRKTIHVPPQMAGQEAVAFLGTMVDSDELFINGERIGATGYRYPPRAYKVPALPEGRCVITIRAIAQNGGYFTKGKQYLLSTASGSIDLTGTWRFRHGGAGKPFPGATAFAYKPTGLYNAMIHPLKDYAIRGAIWYQGESDAGNPSRYAEKFRKLLALWRGDWGYDFPFFTVELAHWGEGGNWDLLRRQQRLALRLPKTAMAAAFDLGEYNDLHPQDKRTVGERLARCALRVEYGEKLPPSPFEVILVEKD